MKVKIKPELQFAALNEDWKEYTAGAIFYSVSDKNHPELPVLSASQKNGMVFRDQIGIDIQYDKNSTKSYKRVTPGQFVIHLRSFQGGFAFSDIEGITSPAYTVLDFKNKDRHDSSFWRNILTSESFIKRLETVTYGIRDGRSISFSDFATLKFKVPTYNQQLKIGDFFKKLDDMVVLHQQELTTLKQTKQGFLQKMFPKEGESVPEFRFTGYTGEWQQLKLDELAEKVSVGIATSSSEYFTNSTESVPFIKNKNIKINRIDDSELEYISNDFDQANATKRVKTGDILTVRTGYPGLSAVVPSHLNNAQTFTTLITRLKDDKALPEFVSTFINSNSGIKQITGMEAGGAQKNVNAGVLKNLVISLPSFNEQEVISKFFSHFDDIITLHQQELDALKQTKKAFLQKMFV